MTESESQFDHAMAVLMVDALGEDAFNDFSPFTNQIDEADQFEWTNVSLPCEVSERNRFEFDIGKRVTVFYEACAWLDEQTTRDTWRASKAGRFYFKNSTMAAMFKLRFG